jgi:nitrogen fixation/metabolism regulation signal transduction histidine kinase
MEKTEVSQLNLHPPRKMRLLWMALMVSGAIGLTLLAVATANTALFQRHYSWLLILNAVVVTVLIAAVGYQIWQVWQARRAQVFGAKLTTRLVAIFAGMTFLPGVLLYLVSSQFLSSSIESWADVKIDKGLAAGLSLAQTMIQAREKEAGLAAVRVGKTFVGASDARIDALLDAAREESDATVAAVINEQGNVIAARSVQGIPKLSPIAVDAWQAIAQGPMTSSEAMNDGVLAARAVLPYANDAKKARALVLWFAIPKDIRDQSEQVNAAFVGYGNFVNGRDSLKQLYGSTLTLTLLLAVFSALGLAMVLAERFAKPLARLAEGTREVSQGNFKARQPVDSSDELGVLTHSFNVMTHQLEDAQIRENAARRQIETSNAYLESVVKNQSAGVLVFDSRFRLKVANTSAAVILQAPLESLREEFLRQWGERQPALHTFAELLKRGFAGSRDGAWQKQSEMMIGGNARTLLIRGSRLPGDTDGGTIVVFDDVSEVIQAQRDTAWAEVARRLAHEIKNPLTPIQLSAERLEMKLAAKLEPEQASVLTRATQTIVSQVSAMKEMVNDFATYARQPKPGSMQPVDLDMLVRDVVALYETHHHDAPQVILQWHADTAMIAGESTRLRQVLHNLLQNAMDAVHERTVDGLPAQVSIVVMRDADELVLRFEDNGPGFAAHLIDRAFEPYVTSKPKGTGLGLAIVKKIIDEHNGHIDVANRPEGGAQVILRFPVHRQAMQTELLHAN